MSVILDALHKARSERHKPAVDGNVARVLDAAAVEEPAAQSRTSRGRERLIAFSVIVGLTLVFALIGGALLLMYNHLQHMNKMSAAVASPDTVRVPAVSVAHTAVPAAPADAALAANPALISPEVLSTPVPLAELPVVVPAALPQAPAAQSAPRPEFTLGSIVCENNDCIASLNGRSVRVGDTVKGYQVTAIDSSTISLKNASTGDEATLSLFD